MGSYTEQRKWWVSKLGMNGEIWDWALKQDWSIPK